MRTIAVVTVARSDYGLYVPILRRITADKDLRLRLIASGSHLSPDFGMTVKMIEADGFEVAEKLPTLQPSDSPQDIARSMGQGVLAFADSFARCRPDILLVLGDRFDMYPAAVAALPFGIPVAHVHGGEVTQGAIDDSLRHSITKLSHLHFASTQENADRIIRMGEEPWRVRVCGAVALDNLRTVKLLTAEELLAQRGIRLSPPPLLVTFHPVTLEFAQAEPQARELLAALDDTKMPVLLTLPNADTNSRAIIRLIEQHVAGRAGWQLVDNLGTRAYFSVMSQCAAMVGNSSSGIIEAASFALPVVNVGNRQKGRTRGANVIDAPPQRAAIGEAIARATSAEFRRSLAGMKNPYDAGSEASKIIVDCLKAADLSPALIAKAFYDGRPA